VKGRVLEILDVLSQLPLPSLYPPPGARVLCIKEDPGLDVGEPWYEVLYENKVYKVDKYMVAECKHRK